MLLSFISPVNVAVKIRGAGGESRKKKPIRFPFPFSPLSLRKESVASFTRGDREIPFRDSVEYLSVADLETINHRGRGSRSPSRNEIRTTKQSN